MLNLISPKNSYEKLFEHIIAVKIEDEIIPINPSVIQKKILDIL
jgi:hypothetical protein